MTWVYWLGLGFAGGFAAAAYVFSKGVRSRVHAVVKGVIWGGRREEPEPPPARAPRKNGQTNGNGTANAPKRRKCFVCQQFSPQEKMVEARIGKQQIWLHPDCQGKLSENRVDKLVYTTYK